EKCCSGMERIEIKSFKGLLVNFCKENSISIIIRGLRATADYEYEYAISLMNKKLASDIETIFLMADTEYSFVSSRIVKEAASYHGDISNLVPDFIIPRLHEKFQTVK
ncbi:MAG: pantetheine-phosphate adenylyltransferase, partial [Spirochaetes bacterium]|nr:pantetheine-phosphate adenylyltransferase [Spirochaetota bacterium]